jgi:undecaprenyl diphosphate synthase
VTTDEIINKDKLPSHVAVIMDGNGRWAQERGNDRIFGHQNGVIAVRQTVEAAAELGIEYLTLYAFSTENWNRPREEIDALMSLLVNTIHDELDTLNKNNIQLMVIGDIESLPGRVREQLKNAIAGTSRNKGLHLVLALSYSGRWEILHAARKVAEEVQSGKISAEDLDPELFSTYLNTNGIPDPELLIRTSGEFRISNFLLWQIAYAELYFTDILWPDFRKEHFIDAILDYQKRERRFGRISSQIRNESVKPE